VSPVRLAHPVFGFGRAVFQVCVGRWVAIWRVGAADFRVFWLSVSASSRDVFVGRWVAEPVRAGSSACLAHSVAEFGSVGSLFCLGRSVAEFGSVRLPVCVGRWVAVSCGCWAVTWRGYAMSLACLGRWAADSRVR
jgi:hypothetical protein